MSESNEGINGIDSIRIGGKKIDELPIAEAALTKQQWPLIIKSDKENKIVNIKARYPKQTVAWIDGAIRECEDSIKKIRSLKDSQQAMINEYTGLISLCKHRDNEIARTKSEEKILELKKQFPPYNVRAMKQQIQQCNEAIFRSDGVIDKEHKSIFELKELRTQCAKRNEELKALGEYIG